MQNTKTKMTPFLPGAPKHFPPCPDCGTCHLISILYMNSEIYKSGELEASSTNQNFRIVQNEGNRTVRRDVVFYNLDVIIAVGYRVNSKRATQFRRWSTNTLKEYIIKGFVLNDKMLKNGKPFGKDYFDELLERIKEIRASEKRKIYKKQTPLRQQERIKGGQ